MKSKPIFIIIGALIVFVLILVWVYLLFFGAPSNTQNVFTNLTGGGEELTDENFEEKDDIGSESENRQKLKQLTTREVAGFREINSLSNPTIYYTEKGTGHIYAIDLTTGIDNRISGTTIPGAYTAEISPQGDYVAIGVKSNNKNTRLVVGKLDDSGSDAVIEDVDLNVDQFGIGDGEELLYTSRDDAGLVGHSYKFSSGLIKNIFNIPFHEAIVDWGENGADTHYFYPKASYLLEGYLYEINNQTISRIPVDGFGLTALANDSLVSYSTFKGTKNNSFIRNRETGEVKAFSVLMIPEKCAFESETDIICAHEQTSLPAGFPDNWYQGTINFKDSLWKISADDSTVTLLTDMQKSSGREVDATNLMMGSGDRRIFFINKNDNTLWMYEL